MWWWPCCSSWVSNGSQKEDKRCFSSPPGWVSAHKRKCMMAITMVWSKSLWPFPESCTAKETQSGHSSSGGRQKDRSTHNSTTMWMWCVWRCTVVSCFTVVSELFCSHPVCMLFTAWWFLSSLTFSQWTLWCLFEVCA